MTNTELYDKFLAMKNSGGVGIHVFKNPNIIYLHLSKCAGTTIYKTLVSACQEVPLDIKEISENFDKYFSFTVVRNTYSKVLSEYNHEINSNLHTMNLDEWLESVCNRKRIDGRAGCFADYSNEYNELDQKSFCDMDGKDYLSYVGRFENLNEVFSVLNDKVGGKLNFPVLNTTNYRKREMSAEQVELIEERFKEDIEYFGFTND